MDKEKNQISWTTLEYDEVERSNDWFWAVGIIALAICVTSIIFKNYMFGIFILIAGFTLAYVSIRKPDEILVTIDHRGIRMRHDLYLYQGIKSFWVEPEHTHTDKRHLLIMTERFFLPMIAVQMPKGLEDQIRNYLIEFLPEKEMTENRSYQFFERLGL